jgi:hypothetical protein
MRRVCLLMMVPRGSKSHAHAASISVGGVTTWLAPRLHLSAILENNSP